jgi:hypothetical protein
MSAKFACAALLFFSLVAVQTAAQDNYGAWNYYRKCSINTKASGANITTPVTRFPFLVRLNTSNFSFSNAQANGGDIRFADTNGNHIPYQIERWVSNDSAEIWVRIDSVHASDSVYMFQMFYGKGSAADSSNGKVVFDTGSGYVGAWHLSDTTDATANGYKASSSSPAPTSAAGDVAKGYSFNGSTQYFTGIAAPPANMSDWTEAAWVKTSSTSAGMVITNRQNANDRSLSLHVGWWAGVAASNGNAYFSNDGAGCEYGAQGTTNIADGNWHFVAGTRSGSTNYSIYVDGALQATNNASAGSGCNTASATALTTWEIGRGLAWAVEFNGSIDELSMSKVARSADWITLAYNTQKATANALVIGSETAVMPQYKTWTGSGTGGKWSDANNWFGQTVPDSTSNVLFDITSAKSCTLDVNAKAFTVTFKPAYAGTFVFTTDTLTVLSSADFSTGGSIIPASGVLQFRYSENFTPKPGQLFPEIVRAGTGATTVTGAGFSTVKLTILSGTFGLGSGFLDTAGSISGSGTLDFGSSILVDTGASVNFAGMSITSGGGTLWFAGSGTQVLTLASGQTLPGIVQSGPGTLQISGANLSAASFSQTAGTLNLNGHDISVTGNFAIANGNHTSLAGFTTGRKITAGGNATLTGQSSSTLLYLASAGYDTLAVSGTLSATYDSISYNYAKVSPGNGYVCQNGGNNTNWNFDFDDYSTWQHRQKVYFNTTSQGTAIGVTVANFPVCVQLNAANFSTGFGQCQASGQDIRFSLLDGTHLKYQKEFWNSGTQTAACWVLVPSIVKSSKIQAIVMYWGKGSATDMTNGPAVFDTANGFRGVWHLTDTTDATFNAFKASSSSPAPASSAGNIGNAYSFNGTTQYFTGIAAPAANLSDWTEGAWVKTSSTSAGMVLTNRQNAADRSLSLDVGYYGSTNNANGNVYYSSDGPTCEYGAQGSTNIADGNWHLITGVRSGTSNYLVYVDGVLQATNNASIGAGCSGTTANSATAWEIGRGLAWGIKWTGSLDEVTMAGVARSADWIALCYGTQVQNSRTVNLVNPIVWGINDSSAATAYQRDKDTGVASYRTTDPNNSSVTISAQYKTAVGGSWTAISTATGAAGAGIDTIVTSNKSLRWKVSSEPGAGVEANYVVRVIASDGTNKDTSQTSPFFVDTKAPSGLANLRPTAVGVYSVTLGWTPATDVNFKNYELRYDTIESNVQNRLGNLWDNTKEPALGTATDSTTSITGLLSQKKYYFKIWAIDSWGNTVALPDTNATTVSSITAVWSKTNLGAIRGGSLGQSVMYITGSKDSIYSITAATGAQNWAAYTGTYGTTGMPTYVFVGGKYVVVVNAGTYVLGRRDDGSSCADLFDLNLSSATGTPYTSPDDSSFYVAYGGNLTKRRIADGGAIANFPVAVPNISTAADMVVQKDNVYVGTTDGKLLKGDSYDFTPLSTFDPGTGAAIQLPLMLVGTTLYATPNVSKLYAVNSSNMARKWASDLLLPAPNTGPLFMDSASKHVYLAAGTNVCRATDNGAGGSLDWTYTAAGTVSSGPIPIKGYIYFGAGNGWYYAVNDTSHGAKTNWPYTGASGNSNTGPWIYLPTGSDSLVIFGTSGNNLDAFKIQ